MLHTNARSAGCFSSTSFKCLKFTATPVVGLQSLQAIAFSMDKEKLRQKIRPHICHRQNASQRKVNNKSVSKESASDLYVFAFASDRPTGPFFCETAQEGKRPHAWAFVLLSFYHLILRKLNLSYISISRKLFIVKRPVDIGLYFICCKKV